MLSTLKWRMQAVTGCARLVLQALSTVPRNGIDVLA
uniref:Uncharacterized protein n=1 Tax=Arundo donax TaxID=35708 RepID=A0A0A9CMC5_ARUDO